MSGVALQYSLDKPTAKRSPKASGSPTLVPRRVEKLEDTFCVVVSMDAKMDVLREPGGLLGVWVPVAMPMKGYAILIEGIEYEFLKQLPREIKPRQSAVK